MKYEIIKGSEKDFDGCSDEILTIYRVKGGLYHQKTDKAASGVLISAIGGCVSIIAERRPITEPVWDGEGLPPVGALCEYHANYIGSHAQYEECEIIAHFDGEGERLAAYVYTQFDGTRLVGQGTAKSFRPIRSPEDVARSNTIGEMERAYEELTGKPAREAEEYYDFIAAGKIQGISKTPTVSELMRVTENATREDCEAIVKMMGGIK